LLRCPCGAATARSRRCAPAVRCPSLPTVGPARCKSERRLLRPCSHHPCAPHHCCSRQRALRVAVVLALCVARGRTALHQAVIHCGHGAKVRGVRGAEPSAGAPSAGRAPLHSPHPPPSHTRPPLRPPPPPPPPQYRRTTSPTRKHATTAALHRACAWEHVGVLAGCVCRCGCPRGAWRVCACVWACRTPTSSAAACSRSCGSWRTPSASTPPSWARPRKRSRRG
jgi:hypothetical protein